jgi:hypothetical protein
VPFRPSKPFSLPNRSKISHLAENPPVNPLAQGRDRDLRSPPPRTDSSPAEIGSLPTNSRTQSPASCREVGQRRSKTLPGQKKLDAFADRLPRTPFEGPDLMKTRDRIGLIGLSHGLPRGTFGKERGKPLSATPAFLLPACRPNRQHGRCDDLRRGEPRPEERSRATRRPPEARAPVRSKILRLADNPRTEGDFPMRTGNAARSRRENPHDARSKQGPAVSWFFMKRDERP